MRDDNEGRGQRGAVGVLVDQVEAEETPVHVCVLLYQVERVAGEDIKALLYFFAFSSKSYIV